MTAYEFLAQALSGEYEVDPDKISPEASLADLGLDSLTFVELLFDVEDEFGIKIPEGVSFETLADAAKLVDELVRAKGG